jgi:gluconokinase
MYYFKKRHPELLAKTKYVLGSKDYLLLQLTGERLTEPSIAAATQMYNINTLDWDKEALEVVGINRSQLPRPVDGMRTAIPVLESVRKELGLTSTKLDVFPGVYDGGALAVGLSGLAPDVGVMNIGTSALVRVPGDKPVFDSNDEMRLQPYCLAEGMYLNGGALNNATLPINWMREKLFQLDLDNIPDLDETKGAPIFCLPYLTGERDSKIGPFASGVFFGLRDHHGKKDLLRSVMEGVAFSLCMVKEALVENKSVISELRLGGGGAGSKTWTQIFADVFDAPIKLPKGEEIALVGSAMIAYTALGVYNSLEQAARVMTTLGETVEPIRENTKIYAEHYQFFKKLRLGMGDLFREHVKLTC